MEDKIQKKFIDLCTKISNIYTDFYVLKHGYILSIDVDKPFLIQLSDEQIEYFNEIEKDFSIIHIINVKEFKKEMNSFYTTKISASEKKKVMFQLNLLLERINLPDKWEKFILSDNENDNESLILSLFKKNNYINFKPIDNEESPDIILTKSILPLVTEKNYTDLYYSSHTLSEDLFVIIFDFDFSLFRLYMVHHYIPIDKE